MAEVNDTWRARFARINPESVRQRLVRNPSYPGQPAGVRDWVASSIISGWKQKPLFYDALCESILAEGCRNPIIVYETTTGRLLSFGGSRLQACKDLRILVPALVVDYTGAFRHDTRVTEDNWQTFFTDVPKYFEWTDYGIDTHYGLERNRCPDQNGIRWTDGLPKKQSERFLAEEFPWLKS